MVKHRRERSSIMNKRCSIFMKISLAVILIFIVSGCSSKGSGGGEIIPDKVNVVTSFYPIYEFAVAIGGEHVNVINLLPTGVEPHDWTPKSKDILNTSKAQLFLYNGAGLEGWVPNFLTGMGRDAVVKPVEVSKGIELIYTDENHDDKHNDEQDHNHDHSIDPHTWISPKSAMIIASNIKDSYIEADPEHQASYEANYASLYDKLEKLDHEYETRLSAMSKHEIVVSHQAFGYLCRDYGLTQHAIMGLSPDAEPRAQDIVALSNLVKDQGIKYVFFEELVSDRIAKTLAKEAGVDTLVLNPVEGLTSEQVKAGDNYFTLMERNLDHLVQALQ